MFVRPLLIQGGHSPHTVRLLCSPVLEFRAVRIQVVELPAIREAVHKLPVLLMNGAIAFVLAVVCGFAIFVFVRTYGEDAPRHPRAGL